MADEEKDVAEQAIEATASKKAKKKKKGGKDVNNSERSESSDLLSPKTDKDKKKKKKKDGDLESSERSGDSPREAKKKKKKSNKTEDADMEMSATALELLKSPKTPSDKKKKKKKEASNESSVELGVDEAPLHSPNASGGFSEILSPSKVKKYTEEYFDSVLDEVRDKCSRKIKIKDADRDKFLNTCSNFYESWHAKWENEQWLHQLEEAKGSQEEIDEAKAYVEESTAALPKLKGKCIKAALKVFDQLDEKKMETLEEKLVKGAIIAQAGAGKLARFTAEGRENEKLIKMLFGDPELMREMLRNGGPAKYEYGNAMKIYTKCLELMGDDLDPKWAKVNKKIALACALELAATIREFDSAVQIDPIERYKHFEAAHRKGELDPAFPHFSVWEMRQIVNCDAPNAQMKWVRDMVMNYVPHITFITDPKLRYTYILQSDVRIRKPTWTGSPRTYQMILSGGGNQSINSWFGRFILKSFGLPAWGAKDRKFEGFCRWTPEGWEPMNGTSWETCTWQGKSGLDFKIEVEARNKAPQQEYWKKLVMLQALADVVDGDPNSIPDEEKDVLHPERLWRSLSIVSMELLFQTEPEVVRTFERKGRSLVKTRNEKYLEQYELDQPDAEVSVVDGVVTIPASHHGFKDGNTMVIDSYGGGKQFNFLAEGAVEYELPDEAPKKKYKMKLEVCTVSAKQTPLTLKVNDDDKSKANIKIPYTTGSWEFTEGIDVELEPGAILNLSRAKGSLGLAIKKIVLE